MKNIRVDAARSLITELHAAGWDAEAVRSWCGQKGFEVTLEDVRSVIDGIDTPVASADEPPLPDQA